MKKRYSLACNCYKITKLINDGTDDNDSNNDRKLKEGSKSALLTNHCGPGSSVGIATDYVLDGPGSDSRWGRNFPPVQTGPGANLAYCTMNTGSFPGLKCNRGVLLTTHPLLAPRSWKSRAIPLPPSESKPSL
jgi:hypothetical protein